MLSTDQMTRMNRLLLEALELDVGERRKWLDALGPPHQDLLAALGRALLPQDSSSGRPARLPEIGAERRSILLTGTLWPGGMVGPYRLIRPLGAGGMAEVWLAGRADGAFKREVALKLPTAARYRNDLAKRFAQERDILAALEHPNIARLYDAGVSAEGLPYLAMEYVRGEPLTTWCDARSLGIRQRLKFFLQVLEAVQYAHQRQVIHRDIKPGNILVSDVGQVRLLDFGVAKLLGQGERHGELTQPFGRALTPEYASPELARGYAIDAAADVYSLGIVLYEVLCGSLPYRLEAGASITQLEEEIAAVRVQPPSTQLGATAGADRGMTQEKLARRLHGDLDAIVLKALAKAPGDRYLGAAALGDDLRRYLNGKPVLARPDRLGYKISRFVVQRRTAMSVALAVALLLAALGYAWIRLEPPRSARTFATTGTGAVASPSAPVSAATSDNSIAVLPFLDLSEHHDQEYFSDGLSEELIDRLARSPDLRVISHTSSFYFKGKRATVGDIAASLHVSYVLEGSVRRTGDALRISAELIRASDGVQVWSQTYDRTLSDVFAVQGEIADKAAAAMQVALRDQVSRAASAPPDAEAHNLLLQGNYFLSRHTQQDAAKAIGYYRDAVQRDPNYALAWANLATADLSRAANGWVEPREGAERARTALQYALTIDPDLATAHRKLGQLYSFFDWDFAGAQAQFERARELDPGDPKTLSSIAELKAARFAAFDEAIDLYQQALLRDPLDTTSLSGLSWTLYCAGRFSEAVAGYRRLLEFNPSFASGRAGLSLPLIAMGRYAEALSASEKETDEGFRLSVLPIVYWAMGRRAESDRALYQLEQKYASEFANNIAEAHAYRGETGAAFQWLERAYRQRDGGMLDLKIDPLLRKLHGDPRFDALLVRMKLAD